MIELTKDQIQKIADSDLVTGGKEITDDDVRKTLVDVGIAHPTDEDTKATKDQLLSLIAAKAKVDASDGPVTISDADLGKTAAGLSQGTKTGLAAGIGILLGAAGGVGGTLLVQHLRKKKRATDDDDSDSKDEVPEFRGKVPKYFGPNSNTPLLSDTTYK